MTIETYINKIMDETGLTPKEIQDLVNKKKEEFKGLISDESALLMIAKELKVDVQAQEKEYLNDIEIKIKDISVGMKNITLIGRINEIYKIFTFNRSDGSEGRVGSFLLNDESGSIRVVLWDDDTKILNHQSFVKNEIVKIYNAYAKNGRDGFVEIHIGKFGKIVLSPDDINHKKIPKITEKYINIKEIGSSLRTASIKGKVIRITAISEFVRNDGSEGKVRSITLGDSTGTIRVVFWNEDVTKIKSLQVGDNISITQLTPKLSNLNLNKYELVANHSSNLAKSNEQVEIKAAIIEKIGNLQKSENLVSFKGVITSLDNLREVNLKSGEAVSVLGFEVSDDTDYIKVTAWREKAVELSKKLKINQSVALKNVKIRLNDRFNRNEVTYLAISEIENINENINAINLDRSREIGTNSEIQGKSIKIESIDHSGFFEIRGNIAKEIDLDKNELFIYDACPICSKKINNCIHEDKENPVKRMILKILLDDETGSIRATFFGDKAEKLLGISADELARINDVEQVLKKIAGKYLIIRGRAELNNFYETNTYDLKVSDFEEINTNEEVNNLLEEIHSFE